MALGKLMNFNICDRLWEKRKLRFSQSVHQLRKRSMSDLRVLETRSWQYEN